MQKRILKHHTKYNTLSTEHYGFRIGLKADNAIYKLTAEILNAMNSKLLVGGILCDWGKVFGCVDHGVLLCELKFCAINGKNLAIYKLYLHNRYIGTEKYSDSDKSDTVSGWEKLDMEPHKALLFLL